MSISVAVPDTGYTPVVVSPPAGSESWSSDLGQPSVTDAEREAAASCLQTAVSEGRISLELFSDRVGAAYRATTHGEIAEALAGLPVAQSSSLLGPTRSAAPAPGALEHLVPFGSVKRTGRWRLARSTKLGVVFGTVKLDLRGAEITAPEVELAATAVFGTIKVWVPRGLRIEVAGTTVVGSRRVADDHSPAPPDRPVLRLRLDAIFGTVKVYPV
jgi:hypothetical protein